MAVKPGSSCGPLVSIPLLWIVYYAFGLIYLSLFTITTIGMIAHQREITGTHCRVPNIFPTISAVIGGVTPERYIWRVGVALASSPCMLEGLIYYTFFHRVATSIIYSWLNLLMMVVLMLENMCLVGLTFVSSTENYANQKNSYVGFVVTSMCHMFFFSVSLQMLRQPPSKRDKKSFKVRSSLAVSHIVLSFISIYFFWRHNTYCEPYIYSMYGVLEYMVVLTSIAFRASMVVDFKNDYQFVITTVKES